MGIVASLTRIRQDIASTARACGRSEDAIRIMAVSKTQSADAIRAAMEAGILLFGENRVQELESKVREGAFQTSDAGGRAEIHLIGHLQSNKVGRAVELADSIDSVDSLRLCRLIAQHAERAGRTIDVLLQCNCSLEGSKSGYDLQDLSRIEETLLAARAFSDVVRIRGMMTIGPLSGDETAIRSSFRTLHDLFEEYKTHTDRPERWDTLSMGMSGDYHIAIEEGSTLVRIGSALFGDRYAEHV